MSLIDLVPTSWVLPAAAVGAALLTLVLGVQTWRLHSAQTDLARESAAWAKQQKDMAQTAQAASEEYREKERLLQAANERVRDAREQDEKRNASVAALVRAGDDRLRDAIAAYAAGSGAAAGDSLASCQSRTAALGQLLEDGLRVQAALATGAEARLADARRMLESERNQAAILKGKP